LCSAVCLRVAQAMASVALPARITRLKRFIMAAFQRLGAAAEDNG
jgi:hypothetical protein